MDFSTILGAWIAVACTLAIMSFVYKDNPLFKIAEHIFVGVSLGWSIAVIWYTVYQAKIIDPLTRLIKYNFYNEAIKLETTDTFWLIIPILLGLLLLALYIPRISWLARYTLAMIYGMASGMAIPRYISAFIFKQIGPTIQPIYSSADSTIPFINITLPFSLDINLIIVLIGIISILVYFFYSIEHKGVVQKISRLGIYFLMISFGAGFGYTVMAREAILIGRMQDLIKFASPTYHYPTIVLLILLILYFMVLHKIEKQKQSKIVKE